MSPKVKLVGLHNNISAYSYDWYIRQFVFVSLPEYVAKCVS